MGLRQLLKRKPRAIVRRTPPPAAPRENQGPKNGILALTLLAATVLLIGLVVVNVRLVRDPSTWRKAAGSAPSASSSPESCPVGLPSPSAGGDGKADRIPPQVTFYTQLQTQDEHPPPVDSPAGVRRTPDAPAPAENPSAPAPKKQPAQSQRTAPHAPIPVSQVQAPVALPRHEAGSKIYTVQVGGFTHPSVAQEWAVKWKARGYDVSIKPIARPRTGEVIYSLYLGHFTSEQEADELVNRLKHKEGISALRLVVRDWTGVKSVDR